MIAKVLVPVDGSAFAEAALPVAFALTEGRGGALRLAMVNEPADLPPGVWAQAFLDSHASYLESLTEWVRERAPSGVEITSMLLEGDVPDAICDEAEGADAELIVMSTHGRGGLARVWLGSVADAVVRRSSVPVLLVRPPAEGEDGERAEPESYAFGDVAVSLDGSDLAEAALAPALDIATRFGSRVTLIRAVTRPLATSSYIPDTVEMTETYLRRAREEAEAYLAEVAARYEDEELVIETVVTEAQQAALGVLREVEALDPDLVVMATHGRGGLARALLGSVADKVVRGSHTPVLLVRPRREAGRRSVEVA